MLLNVLDRIAILQILPAEGDIVTLRVLRELKTKLSFTDVEFAEFELKEETPGSYTWNKVGAEGKEFELGEKTTNVIKDAFLDWDKRKQLKPYHLDTYDKFVTE